MNVTINDEVHTLASSDLVLDELITDILSKNGDGIAIAVNDNIIPRQKWGNYRIKENDKILVITATQGG